MKTVIRYSAVAFALLACCLFGNFVAAQETLEEPKQEAKPTQEQEPEDQEKPGAEQEQDDKKSKQDPQSKPDDQKPKVDEPEESPRRSSGTWGGFGISRSSSKVSKRDASFIKVFEPIAASMDAATIPIMLDDKQVALGTVVESDGLILTKASELKSGMSCVIDGKNVKPVVVGIHPETDLALLRVDAQSLNTIQWAEEPIPVMGRWVASPKAEAKGKPAIGIISTEFVREIPPSRPFIGIQMIDTKEGVQITEIVPRSPARDAGLEKDDYILEIDGKEISDRVALVETVGQYDVGDRVAVVIKRDGEKKTVKLTLVERDKVAEESQRANQQNSMGSDLSRRRKDFPKAFQHDSMLNSNTCGGPIVDLTGKAIGINIARDGRVSSLALPVDVVVPIIELLKSGELAPAIVNKAKIELIEAELAELAKTEGKIPEKKNVLNVRYNRERARLEELEDFEKDYRKRIEELEKMVADYNARLKEVEGRKESVEDAAEALKKDLDGIRFEIRNREKVKSKLEKDLENLRTGSSS